MNTPIRAAVVRCLLRPHKSTNTISRIYLRQISQSSKRCQIDPHQRTILGRSEARAKPYTKTESSNRFEKPVKYEAFSRRAWRRSWQTHPYSMITSVALLTAVVGFFGYHITKYYFIIVKNLRNYPRSVSTWIRQAIGFEMRQQYKNAINAYEHAIQQAYACDMDPLSDPLTGLKVKYAEVWEKTGELADTTRVLEEMKKEWLDVLAERKSSIKDMERSRVMVKVVGVSLKLAELYENMREDEKSKELLDWAVKTTLTESRRKVLPYDEDVRDVLWNPEVVGATLEQCAEYYERHDRHDLATTLFLEALSNIQPPTCHSVVIMNNIAATISQQAIPANTPTSRDQQLETAKSWAHKALTLSASIPSSQQDQDCTVGCVVALHNLGEFEEQMGNMKEAARLYTESEALAKKVAYELGMEKSQISLSRLREERRKGEKWVFYRNAPRTPDEVRKGDEER